jgi:hypothetical protein
MRRRTQSASLTIQIAVFGGLQLLQFAPHGGFIERHRELVVKPLDQVDQAPANDTMDRRDRSALDHRSQRLALSIIEPGPGAGGLLVDQPGRPRGVEAQHPVPHHLERYPTEARRVAATTAVVDRRQRQQTPRLIGVIRPLRKPAQRRPVIVLSKRDWRGHGKPPVVCHGESQNRPRGNPQDESQSARAGIRSFMTAPPRAAIESELPRPGNPINRS